MVHPGGAVFPAAETCPFIVDVPAVDAPPCTEAVTEIFCETLLLVSVAVMVIVALPDGVALVVETVKTAEPEPPVIEVVSKLAIMFELAVEELRETVPVKPFTAVMLIVNVAEAPAVMTCDVGLADSENSEFPPPLVVEPTVRRGEITQPFAKINSSASNNVNLGMEKFLFPRPVPIKERLIHLDCLCRPRCLPWERKQFVRVELFCKTNLRAVFISVAEGCFKLVCARCRLGELRYVPSTRQI